LRRIIIAGTTFAVLAGAVAAIAATQFNSYQATETFTPNHAGTASHPAPYGIVEDWKAHGNNGQDTAPLVKIVAKIYGQVTDAKDFPKCTAATINNAGKKNGTWNKACPGGETGPALIGQGPVNALFVAATQPKEQNPPQCNPYLYIYNGGVANYKGKPTQEQVFFFTEYPFAPGKQYTCLNGAVHTGAAAAYPGYVSQSGKTWILTIPLPANVSTSAGGIPNNYASLVHLHVTYAKKTEKKNGKTIAFGGSVACQNGQRPWEFDFTAQNYKPQSNQQTEVVKGSQPCS
jgi:hypothetical protein